MRSNRNDSERGNRDSSRSGTTATTISSGYGTDGTGGDGSSYESAEETTQWFEPVGTRDDVIEEFSDCPGGVCPVPWATDTSGDDLKESFDLVNHPLHYTDGNIECIEAIEAQLTSEEYRGYLKGNVAKYVWREKHKGGIESLEKAQWYLSRLIEGK